MTASEAAYERGAERLFAVLVRSGASRASFAERVRSALDRALEMLAAEPELAWLLAIEPYEGERALLEIHWSWLDRYAAVLRRAAGPCSAASCRPSILEPALLHAARWQIARALLAGRAAQLPDLAPELSRYLLCHYRFAAGNNLEPHVG